MLLWMARIFVPIDVFIAEDGDVFVLFREALKAPVLHQM